MKKLLLVLLVMVLRVALLIPASPAGTDLSGTWMVTMTDFEGHVSVGPCAIRQQGQQLSVRFVHGAELVGAVEHRRAEWHWQNADVVFTFTAVVAETCKKMCGTWKVHFKDDGSEQNATFSAMKTP